MNSDTRQETITPGRGVGGPLFLLAMFFSLTLGVAWILAPGETTGPAVANEAGAPAATTIAPTQAAGEVAVAPTEAATEPTAVSLPEQYQLDARWGDLGPQLVAAGAIDAGRFVQLYADSGRPLTAAQKRILNEGSDEPIVIDFQNDRFLLNFFWALGLVNQNPILTEGPMVQYSEGDIGRFASTGGWTLGRRPATELYASVPLITLTAEQQARLEDAAANVYRPCCNNHTAFADCNHGMAMLGLLQLLASQDASLEQMFAAAKAVNGFWFPQQALETAVFFKATMNLDYADVEPRMATGPEVFSGRGFRQVHQWLAENDLLTQPQGGGNSCGV